MRTSGTFQDVYAAARDYYHGTVDGQPHDPVVRREGGDWMLESALETADADFECELDAFDSYFRDDYSDPGYSPSDADVDEFCELFPN